MVPRAGFIRTIPVTLGLALAAVHPVPAEARGFVGFSFGMPLFGPPAYYPPPVYDYPLPPPAYYYPPPTYYAPPPPAYYAPPPAYYAPPPVQAPAGQECREYRSTVNVGGVRQPIYGTACRQPDGSWRIVQ